MSPPCCLFSHQSLLAYLPTSGSSWWPVKLDFVPALSSALYNSNGISSGEESCFY